MRSRAVLDGLFTTVLVLYFLLVAGEIFLRRVVEVLPNFGDKRQAVDISQQIEADISAYMLTITAMNAAVGVATGVAMYLCGLGDPLLWGAAAFLLNYVPILGPLFGIAIFLLVGMLSFDSLWWALFPPALYLGIHLVEGETLTPMLGRNYRLGFVVQTQRSAPHFIAVFDELQRSGFVEGVNLSATGEFGVTYDRLDEVATALVKEAPDAIVCGREVAPRILQRLTTTIPIVAIVENMGPLVTSFAHPGGNTTGISIFGARR